jgi:hypothetical protein
MTTIELRTPDGRLLGRINARDWQAPPPEPWPPRPHTEAHEDRRAVTGRVGR